MVRKFFIVVWIVYLGWGSLLFYTHGASFFLYVGLGIGAVSLVLTWARLLHLIPGGPTVELYRIRRMLEKERGIGRY